MGYIGMCGPKGYDFLVVLVRNRISILAILVIHRVWFCILVLNWLFLFYRIYVFIIINKTINKSPSSATTMKIFACPFFRF